MSDTPVTWAWSTIGEIAQHIQRGKSPKYADHSALPVINQKSIRWDELQLQYLKYVHPDQFEKWDESRHIRAGDVLWNSTGTGTVGRAYLVRDEDCTSPKVVDSHVTIVRPASAIEPRYLFNWIKSPAVQDKIEEMCDGTTNQIELSRAAIAATEIPIPPRAEQTRIADQLDFLLARVNACNDHLDAIPGILKRFRQAVLRSAIAGELTAEQRTTRGWADSWKPMPLRQLGELGRGKSRHRPRNDARLYGGPYPFIQTGDVAQSGGTITHHDQTYSEFGLQQSKLWPAGTVCITIAANIADTSVLAYPACFPDSVVGFIADGEKCVNEFVKWSIDVIKNDLESFAPATAQKNINLSVLNDVVIRCPSLDEQREIVRQVKSLHFLADRIERRYTALRAHAQRLAPQVLAKAFRGELVEQDPQDEPASMLLLRLATSQPTKVLASRGRPRAQPKPQPSAPDRQPSDWSTLPDGTWVAPADPDGHITSVWLTAVLRAWGVPMPERTARLATLLCQQPHLFTPVLPAAQASLWSRLVGDAAVPLPAQVTRLQPTSNHPWGRVLQGMRMRGDLVEAGTGDGVTWALGPGAAAITTSGWPDGRAGFVVAHLRAHGLASVLPALAPAERAFVDARAA